VINLILEQIPNKIDAVTRN